MDDFILNPDDLIIGGPPAPLDPATASLSDLLVSDATLQGPAASWLDPGPAIADACCTPALPAGTTLGFSLSDGTVVQLPAEDSTGSGRPDRVSLDLDQDGVADAWGYDSAGSGQVDMLLFDANGDGLADAVSHHTASGWTPVEPLAPAPAATTPASVTPAPAATTPAPLAPAPAAPAPAPAVPFTPAAAPDSDGDGRSDAVDAWPRDPYDSGTRDRDHDGTADAFDNEPTRPFTSSTRDQDNDGRADAFDNEPTRPFTSTTRDNDNDGTTDYFDREPRNRYEDD